MQVTAALGAPSAGALLTQFSINPFGLAAVLLGAAWYWRALTRLDDPWPRRRTAAYAAGLLLLLWSTCGGFQAYADSVLWVWTTQILCLLLIVPIALIGGQPVELARQSRSRPILLLVNGPVGRLFGNSFLGPALVPILSAGLFFGPLPGWAIATPAANWLLQVVVTIVGCLIVLPMLDAREVRHSMVIGFALVIGSLELLLDAIPGIVLRLQTHPASTYFRERHLHPWSSGFLHDQQLAGAVLWTVAEILDLPFLVVIFVRWHRADAREAASLDAVLDAERFMRAGATDEAVDDNAGDAPWWLSDPSMQTRLHRPD
jgi:putative membrane protein